MKWSALLHVGLAKCASTFLGDQALMAADQGVVSALVWEPFDLLVNQAAREIGLGVEAFPDAPLRPVFVSPDRPMFGSNECLTGHFPPPLRIISYPVYTPEMMKALQLQMADLLHQMNVHVLNAFDVHILIVARNPAAWLRSLYRNLAVMGVSELPDAFFKCFGPVAAQWADLNYLVEIYGGLFGAQNVCVLPMEMLRDDAQSFFDTVNGLIGVNLLTENETRNVGLSDGASERFRKFWTEVDRIAPPEPSWENRTVQYKQQTWKFLHNAIMNDKHALLRANAVWADDTIRYEMPADLIEDIRSRMTVLQGIGAFHPYLGEYFPARAQ